MSTNYEKAVMSMDNLIIVEGESMRTSKYLKVYFAISIPLTAVVFGIWYVFFWLRLKTWKKTPMRKGWGADAENIEGSSKAKSE